ncbi:HAD family hydrolase [Leucobacter chinensis]|uniref:HAD family hydrolase n=1 Tax=Leucobacter chinensis TaxID=2851010 RepID=UPI001C21787A|nr:HAD family phosphatase [Leucobacter chinensis]
MTEPLLKTQPQIKRLPAAVLCDLDGTLLDTEQPWLDTVRETLEGFGIAVTQRQLLRFEGATVSQTARLIIEDFFLGQLPRGLSTPAELGERIERVSLRVQRGTARWKLGAREMLDDLREAEVPVAIVTSSSRRWYEQLAGEVDLGWFEYVITADDVFATKPDPEPYQHAARLFGLRTSECLALEDSKVGMRAALAAGCRTVLVRAEPSSGPETEYEADSEPWAAEAHVRVSSLVGLGSDWATAVCDLDRLSPFEYNPKGTP